MPALLAALALLLAGPLARAEVLNQRLIYNQDPWDADTHLEVDCAPSADGSVSCDTRPPGQAWVETTITGD